jgi:hypothetical protein
MPKFRQELSYRLFVTTWRGICRKSSLSFTSAQMRDARIHNQSAVPMPCRGGYLV